MSSTIINFFSTEVGVIDCVSCGVAHSANTKGSFYKTHVLTCLVTEVLCYVTKVSNLFTWTSVLNDILFLCMMNSLPLSASISLWLKLNVWMFKYTITFFFFTCHFSNCPRKESSMAERNKYEGKLSYCLRSCVLEA